MPPQELSQSRGSSGKLELSKHVGRPAAHAQALLRQPRVRNSRDSEQQWSLPGDILTLIVDGKRIDTHPRVATPMIPAHISKAHIAAAIRQISRAGIPPPRRGRSYCLVTNGEHFPPKYAIALAHQIATGEWLHSDRFSGGRESNEFLRRHGFDVVQCRCGGSVQSVEVVFKPSPPPSKAPSLSSGSHSQSCSECKDRIAELLERIYGACERNKMFKWPTALGDYADTAIHSVLSDVAQTLKAHRGYDIDTVVKAGVLAGCDYWVPYPGFVVEFDERQHFSHPRKRALSTYADRARLGFSARRWMDLCEQHDARDNSPKYRDEQRAWYDTLRDLVPSIKDMPPTVRLYASDQVWCSLDPDRKEDREAFAELLPDDARPVSIQAKAKGCPRPVCPGSRLRMAMVFPKTERKAPGGVPPGDKGAPQPEVPTAARFAGESVDFVLFPEEYISASDDTRVKSLGRLAVDLGAPLLVGAVDRRVDHAGRVHASQVLLRFDPGSSPYRLYTKHSTAKAVAFERPDWDSHSALPTFELCGVTAGATICHDHYLGLLPRFLAKRGARLWVNPSYDNVKEIKWSSILRLRAVENRFFSLCTLHCNKGRPRTHPFGFAPDGTELFARPVGSELMKPLSKCCEAGKIYVVDLDMDRGDDPLDWSKIPPSKEVCKRQPKHPIRIALRDGRPSVLGRSGWHAVGSGLRVESRHGPVYVGLAFQERILDASVCFQVLDQAGEMTCAPVIWNHWEQLPADSAHLATLMMGRAIECCAPIVLSDKNGIHEVVELSNNYKTPARRITDVSREVDVDLRYARGMRSAFAMVTKSLPTGMSGIALERYRSLA